MEIKKAAYVISNADYKACPAPDRPEFAFIGRSNVGKSSLINMLCKNNKLAKTSSAPGKTQLINHFEIESSNKTNQGFKKWYLVDLPGYGFAKVAQSSRRRWEQMIENYLRKRENLVNVFVLIDSRHKPQNIDLEFISQLDKWQIPFSLVFTKTDKEKPTVVANNIQAFFDTLRSTWQFLPQHFVTSAEKHQGREEILAFIQLKNESIA
ncbi:MAG TPA: ribosome biogenesis GTP-binding protein YihA/YsxC [Sediminibacterium sp.]|jgi:GTP-binding protein|uniref:ribosome biogenesis GTP-binding protein YihA/YsxC n=1 Tax=Sediminibacterium sp. TaxID=1917865 RepID=UPI0008CC3B16|nr:ribosome biogenesis GTP-binding protein YihA/YsxC [Sediminibacterium sp.]OHC86780.1 MAG: YihA family ribosome biogenesis GTP-binding protein [Sphingobacteriia bacterium RIFOXYC2_FULL_35_18]OHC88361.1 MAG: YihA family ribosome biogenesis GTP-binding protein [Sphingobacteriia bacterium RIFOXYD2_FULL_35_12]OYY11140.1 MAG: YihA family ribosome biogenesis GTP-binding protein [Sphingobacteriia bacterium 35-36-14]OYZ54053.1 MAG: YihA family ribosome biogenesis GTP-binding protein [Sphingobacteriia 